MLRQILLIETKKSSYEYGHGNASFRRNRVNDFGSFCEQKIIFENIKVIQNNHLQQQYLLQFCHALIDEQAEKCLGCGK